MLGWLLLGVILGAAVITIAVSYLDKKVAREKLKSHKIKKAFVKDIIKDQNVTHIKLEGIDEDCKEREIQFDADDIDSSEIYKGITIYT